MSVLIKSGTLVTASETFQADILIEGEKIKLIGLISPKSQIDYRVCKIECRSCGPKALLRGASLPISL